MVNWQSDARSGIIGDEQRHLRVPVQRRGKPPQDGRRRTADGLLQRSAWRGLAENVARFCKKGNKVAVTGSIQIRQYEDRDGQKRTSVDVTADEVEFLTPKNAERDEGEYVPAAKKKPALEEFEDGDIPF